MQPLLASARASLAGVGALLLLLLVAPLLSQAFQPPTLALPSSSMPSFTSVMRAPRVLAPLPRGTRTTNMLVLLPLSQHRPSKSTTPTSTALAAASDGSVAAKKPAFLKVLWRFTRPHTFIGTALCVPALHMYAAPAGAPLLAMRVLASILWALLPSALINVYITGLNQVTDVEIDKINKPYLPIAAGQLSPVLATVVVLLSLVAGLGLGFLPSVYGSRALVFVLLASVFLGTSYSLPPLRLKRFPIMAALCIIAVRGTVINMGFYGHALHAAFGQPEAAQIGPLLLTLLTDMKCMLATVFFAVFGAVIALMKDVPDIKGDKLNDIKSFSVRAGAGRIFRLGKRMMISLFVAAAIVCFGAAQNAFLAAGGVEALQAVKEVTGLWPFLPAFLRSVIAMLALASSTMVQRKAALVNPQNGKEVYDYYMFLWKLFYLSYLALPLAR